MDRSNQSHFSRCGPLLFTTLLLGFFLAVALPEPTSAQNPEPEVRVLYPNGGETVNGTVLIQWEVLNPPAETPRFTVSYWFWEEPKWVPIVSGITGTSYPWDTRDVPNGQYVIQVTLTTVSPTISDESNNFFIVDNGDLPRVRVFYPNGGEIVGGTVLLTWSVMNPGNYKVSFEVYYWNGAEWLLLIGNYPSVSFSWDTTQVPDGAYYRIKVILYSELGVSEDTSDGTFTIHNGERVAHAPTVRVTHPNGGETLTGQVQITWIASDPDGDVLTYSLRCWDGAQWHMLAQNLETINWTWNTLQYTNGTGYVLEVMASDGTFFASDQSDTIFSIYHVPPVVDILSPRPAPNESVVILTKTAWINWTVTNPANYQLTYGIDLWINNQWLFLAQNLTITEFQWDTREFPDGEAYKLRVLAYFGPLHSEGITDPAFHIANAEPEARGRLPEVELEAPHGGETWKSQRLIKWIGADPDGNPLTYNVHYWNGTRWVFLVENLRNTSYSWDTSRLSSRTDYRVQVTAFDGIDRGLAVSEEFAIGGNPPIVEFLYPRGGETLQGNVTLTWTAFDPDRREMNYTVEYRHHHNWTLLITKITDTTFLWDTRSIENGQDYQLRVTANNSLLTGEALVEDPLTIENNFPPTVTVTWPNGGEELQGTVDIRWTATDPNDPPDNLSYTVSYYLNEEEWVIIAEDLHVPHYVWDTLEAPNLNWTVIRVHATDPGNLTAVDDSDAGFMIVNRPSGPPSPSEPPRFLKWLFYGVVILFMAITTLVAYGIGLERAKKTKQAAEGKIQLERRIKKVKTRLKVVQKQEKALRRTPPVRGWPKDLTQFQARLDNLEQKPAVVEYFQVEREVEERQDAINRYLSMLGGQVAQLLSYIDKDTIEPQEGIGPAELSEFAEDPLDFFKTRTFGDIVPLATRVRAHLREAQVSWEAHKLSPEPFLDEKIGALLKQEQALLQIQADLKEKENDPQVAAYLQGRTLFQQLQELERKKTRYNALLRKLNARLCDLENHLE